MRLLPSDPDISTIIKRIQDGDINLQPDFQRGEVWSIAKKQRLIDSILRDWHIPPIHVVEVKDSSKLDVLDGQQRLAAIRDFVNGIFYIDGTIAPVNDDILNLNGLYYIDLADKWRRRFDQFTIRLFKITDYSPQEPGELFFRLNQPVSLTSAEQRNAFYGEARGQIKGLVELLNVLGLGKEDIGFSNSRMAYDDIIARVCYSLEVGDLLQKVTAYSLTNRYRFDEPFSGKTITLVERGIYFLHDALSISSGIFKFNKATLYTWMWFICDNIHNNPHFNDLYFVRYARYFEWLRLSSKNILSVRQANFMYDDEFIQYKGTEFESNLMAIYNDRASARVADVSSVLSRDIVVWTLFVLFSDGDNMGFMPMNYDKVDFIAKGLHNYGKFARGSAENYVAKMIENGWNGHIE
ncbi:DUF262 domain-containing protein [Hymenobacter sp. HMF4947]|uniref:DUF262 domain-containing protein n=1 Tax=Hymenobacter ginkgonis TaxID=2682976 RepID=A0A7K1T9H9_9BACT|nr:DUF262 domain-containing protein [Hymenobacter ginkgonis]MVN75066.1 DUF262 domain-containing protein [Hymenobacter ginkgonis]